MQKYAQQKKLIDFYEDENGCYICTSHSCNSGGYPRIVRNGKRYSIHRFIYEQCFGDIPPGMEVCHKCDTPSCINPEHLFLGTNKDNVDDMISKRRHRNQYGDLRFTTEQIYEIKSARGISQIELAKRYGVSNTTIQKIQRGKHYSYLYPELNRKPNQGRVL